MTGTALSPTRRIIAQSDGSRRQPESRRPQFYAWAKGSSRGLGGFVKGGTRGKRMGKSSFLKKRTKKLLSRWASPLAKPARKITLATAAGICDLWPNWRSSVCRVFSWKRQNPHRRFDREKHAARRKTGSRHRTWQTIYPSIFDHSGRIHNDLQNDLRIRSWRFPHLILAQAIQSISQKIKVMCVSQNLQFLSDFCLNMLIMRKNTLKMPFEYINFINRESFFI